MNRPNIVFILADDLGVNDLSCEGSLFYESPNIDSIAASGMRFTQGYASCQVCSPSRASILTGKVPPRHGITDWIGASTGESWRALNRHNKLLPPEYERGLRSNEITFPQVLHRTGYQTFFAGKWHLGDVGQHPEQFGFETNIGGWKAGWPRGGYFSPYDNPELTDVLTVSRCLSVWPPKQQTGLPGMQINPFSPIYHFILYTDLFKQTRNCGENIKKKQ